MRQNRSPISFLFIAISLIFPQNAFAYAGSGMEWNTLYTTVMSDLSGPTAQALSAIGLIAFGFMILSGLGGEGWFIKKLIKFLFGTLLAMNAAMVISTYLMVTPTLPTTASGFSAPAPSSCPNPGSEAGCSTNIAVASIRSALTGVSGYITQWAEWLFLALATFQLTWSGFKIMIDSGGESSYHTENTVGSFVWQVFEISLFYTLILKAGFWINSVMDGFVYIGNSVLKGSSSSLYAGTSTTALAQGTNDPGAIITNGTHLAQVILSNVGSSGSLLGLTPEALMGDIMMVVAAIAVFIGYLLMAVELVYVMLEFYLLQSVGVLVLGFNGANFSRQFSSGLLPRIITSGLKYMTILILAAAGNTLSSEWEKILTPASTSAIGLPSTAIQKKYSGVFTAMMQSNPSCFQTANQASSNLLQQQQAAGYSASQIASLNAQDAAISAQTGINAEGGNTSWKIGDGTVCGNAALTTIESNPSVNYGTPEAVLAVGAGALIFGLIAMRAPRFVGSIASMVGNGIGGTSLSGSLGSVASSAGSIATSAASMAMAAKSMGMAGKALFESSKAGESGAKSLRSGSNGPMNGSAESGSNSGSDASASGERDSGGNDSGNRSNSTGSSDSGKRQSQSGEKRRTSNPSSSIRNKNSPKK